MSTREDILSPGEIADLHTYCGADAAKWAEQFRLTAIRLGYSDMDEGWLIGWFANAIERAEQVRHPYAAAPTPPAAEAPGQEPVADEIERVKAAIAYVIAKGDGLFLDAVSRTAILAMDRRAEVVEQKFYHSGWPMVRLLEARHGGMVIDEGEAWFYSHTSKDGFGGAYDLLYRRATPPAPAEPAHGLNLETNPAMRERLVELSEQGATDDYDRVVMMLVRDFARCMAHIAPLQDFAARHASPPAPAVAVTGDKAEIVYRLRNFPTDDGNARRLMLDAAMMVEYLAEPAPAVAVPEGGVLALIVDALEDAASGMRYVRQEYGDLSGVGFDRVQEKYLNAVRALAAAPEPPATRSEEPTTVNDVERIIISTEPIGDDDATWTRRMAHALHARLFATRPEAEIRNEGIEMAAKWHEDQYASMEGKPVWQRLSSHREDATAIRALKEPGDVR